jgi:DNA polymerase-3 subunit epsilon
MKFFYFDLETTGVRFWKDGIHQISGCVDINGKIEEWIDIKVQPNPKAEISDDALAVSKVTREEISQYMPFEQGYRELKSVLDKYVDKYDKKDKMFMVGYNIASFDTNFLRAFFVQNGDDYFGSYFYSAPLDVIVLAAQYLATERAEMKDFKLGTVAEFMGIQVDALKQHDARYDIEITRELHRRVIDIYVKFKTFKHKVTSTPNTP